MNAMELWDSLGNPPVRRARKDELGVSLAQLFWKATRHPLWMKDPCSHLFWDERRGTYGPWCRGVAHANGKCFHHGGQP